MTGNGGSGPDRYRMLLSDGVHTHSCECLRLDFLNLRSSAYGSEYQTQESDLLWNYNIVNLTRVTGPKV